jgi:CheY-specific phosphatase CheX
MTVLKKDKKKKKTKKPRNASEDMEKGELSCVVGVGGNIN